MVGLASSSPVVALVLLSARATAFGTGPSTSRLVVNLRHGHLSMQATAGIKGYFSLRDVQLIERRQEDVDAFNAKERNRWDVVYEEECPESLLESLLANGYFPGDRVKIVNDVKVKDIENAKGMQGVVSHYEFDDGYEACQTCSTAVPVAVVLDP